MMQTDLKRLIAYSSVSHLGFVVLGIFALTEQGMSGSVLQMVNHGLSTGLLFICVGLLYDRTHTREMSEMGGLASTMPLLARRVPVRDAVLDRPAGDEQLRRGVPRDPRDVQRAPGRSGRSRRPA